MARWLVQGLIPSGSSLVLLGEMHSGKAWLAEQLAVCVASGHDFLDTFARKARRLATVSHFLASNV